MKPTRATAAIGLAAYRRFSTLKRLPLEDIHEAASAKWTEFFGWRMPLSYHGGSVLESVLDTRSSASLFDISHMARTVFTCSNDEFLLNSFINTLLPLNFTSMPLNSCKYTFLLNAEGGIVDDAILVKYLLKGSASACLITNAALHFRVAQLILNHSKMFPSVMVMPDVAPVTLALQGPASSAALSSSLDLPIAARGSDGLEGLGFMRGMDALVAGDPAYITRTGYTGEDGFEINCPVSSAKYLVSKLLHDGGIKWAGLAARDILRIEAGLPLSGQDIHDLFTPIDAGLAWAIDKARRDPDELLSFPGKARILTQLNHPELVRIRRVGLISISEQRGPVPLPMSLLNLCERPDLDGRIPNDALLMGVVTSGAYSPCLNKNIALAYICSDDLRWKRFGDGGHLLMDVKTSKKHFPYRICKLPFVPNRYYRLD